MTSDLYSQEPLFPLDPWGCEGVFVVVDHPHPAIARAVVGPLVLGQDDSSVPQRLRYIALHTDRHFLYSGQIQSQLRINPDKFWTTVASQFDAANLRQVGHQTAALSMTPDDSVEKWSDSEFWMSDASNSQRLHKAVHVMSKLFTRYEVDDSLQGERANALRCEQLAQTTVNAQLVAALVQMLQAMVPELRTAYTLRPRLSSGMVNRLLTLAQADGVIAIKYMLQAIQTGSFGLLQIMAFNNDCPAAQEILGVIFSGGSLPNKFKDLGISKGGYRRSLFRSDPATQQKFSQPFDISNLYMPGLQWLTAMQLAQRRLVYSLVDWQELGGMLGQMQLLALGDESLHSALIAHCVKDGYIGSGVVLNRLCSNAHSLTRGAMHIAKVDLAFEVAIGMALQWDTDPPVTRRRNSPLGRESDWTDPATLFLVICELYGLDSRASLETILDSHPGIPVGFSEPTGLLFLPLNSLEMTFAHGTEMNNCLWENHAVASYMADGAALYAIKVNGIAVGTIALNREVNERDQNIKVLEISGQNNQSVGEELGELAQSLADSWNAECSSMKWTRYYAQCRRLLLG